mgnify:CR=1 FL=1
METNKKRNSMDTIQLTISKQQFFGMLQAMPEQDKLEVFDRLRRSLFVSRFDRLLKSVRTDELSLDDITREVETVRQEHYEKRLEVDSLLSRFKSRTCRSERIDSICQLLAEKEKLLYGIMLVLY